jgi:hypothetical protein
MAHHPRSLPRSNRSNSCQYYFVHHDWQDKYSSPRRPENFLPVVGYRGTEAIQATLSGEQARFVARFLSRDDDPLLHFSGSILGIQLSQGGWSERPAEFQNQDSQWAGGADIDF